MNIVEFVAFSLLAAFVMICSRELGHLCSLPEAAAVIPVTGLLVLLFRVVTKISLRRSLILSMFLLVVIIVSMGLAHLLALRDPSFASPVAAGLVVIANQARLWVLRRTKTPDATKL